VFHLCHHYPSPPLLCLKCLPFSAIRSRKCISFVPSREPLSSALAACLRHCFPVHESHLPSDSITTLTRVCDLVSSFTNAPFYPQFLCAIRQVCLSLLHACCSPLCACTCVYCITSASPSHGEGMYAWQLARVYTLVSRRSLSLLSLSLHFRLLCCLCRRTRSCHQHTNASRLRDLLLLLQVL